ncbi:MAG: ABC transporter permease [Chloroflexi bacterium]|nr:MAG: ABC transporter permease [Chloroflexota bacterium]
MVSLAKVVGDDATRTRRYPVRRSINIYDLIPLLLFVILVGLIFVIKPRLLNPQFIEVKSNAGLTMILATVGQAFVLLSGGIDLSIGGVISLTNSLAATQMQDTSQSVLLWVAIIVGIGLLAGLVNGLVVAVLRVAPFIATLATWSILNGLALLVLEDPGGKAAAPLKSFVRSDPLGIPNSLLAILILAGLWLLFKRSKWGTRLYAVGSEEARSRLNGVNVVRVKVMAYMLSGLFGALAGIYRTVEVSKGSPIAGDSFILTSAAAALVGGVALGGGRGELINAMLGGFIMLFIFDLITFAGVSSFYTSMVQGLFLIGAVSLNIVGSRARIRKALEQ